MVLKPDDFTTFHAAVHNSKPPFAWQQRLLEQIVQQRRWPSVLDLPTGAGKTTCIDIALFALALDAYKPPEERWCPRRIVMVVDRRTIVDQAAERGRILLRALSQSREQVVIEVAERLRSLTRTGEDPLGVYTLRGGIPKDDGWARTPDQPLIIASTVDQVGSRMLMQGYGVSHGMKPVHAGLLANDVLLLLDEVHLSEPFRQTLDQLTRIRERFSGNGLPKRFSHVLLSATPGPTMEPPFALIEEDKAPDSPLGLRLHASKPVRLIEVEDRPALEKQCVELAKGLLERHRTIAVVVNRVGSANEIARQLDESLKGEVIVTLLTGRIRPLDRDDLLRELLPAVKAGRERNNDLPRRVVVATQCIEAGADFDFDAIVTEAASLDSLRQRFGRVDRLGHYGKAEGIIIYTDSKDDDPIYGKSIAETYKWLMELEKKREKELRTEIIKLRKKIKKVEGEPKRKAEEQLLRKVLVDFGVMALDVPYGKELEKLLAPKENAPTLLPAYMDLWAQTSPPPCQLPDVSLWLHGQRSSPSEVQVIWRADLSKDILERGDSDTATNIVSSIRPSSLEAVSLPYVVARAWLSGKPAPDAGDAEGEKGEEVSDSTSDDGEGRRALRWNGDESDIITAASLKPGDTIVVPASYGGIRNGCFDPSCLDPVSDVAEQANLFTRARPLLRLHPEVVKGLGLYVPLDEIDETREALARLAETSDWPGWKKLWLNKLGRSRGSFPVRGDPGWYVLQAKRVPYNELRQAVMMEEALEQGVELTTDIDDSYFAGCPVSLEEHCGEVERYAREYALKCGLNTCFAEHLALAAWLHDIGKVDKRFQLLLRGGSEIQYFKDETPLAKSSLQPGARAVHRLAQSRSGYPLGARHEVQSLAMLQAQQQQLAGCLKERLRRLESADDPDLDLVLHLVSSHHGYCRPIAPVVVDDMPVEVSLEGHKSSIFGQIDFLPISSQHNLYRLDSPLADRFWKLMTKYGWQELCWLEAMLRLADHRVSEKEQDREA